MTGHRTQGLAEAGYNDGALRESVRQVLRQIQEIAQRLGLLVVSPLAEGADRIVAEEALKLGYELESPLPFVREEYEKDFRLPESRAAFRHLLGRARTVYELNGSREHANQAYEAVGRWVLLHSNILIAIWNGKPAAGQGGTGQMVKESLSRGIATVWVRPHGQMFLLRSADPILYDPINRLSEAMGRVLTARGMSWAGPED